MSSVGFEWDRAKAQANLRAYGVTFETARTVFDDPYGHDQEDNRKEYHAVRQIRIGRAAGGRLLTVVYTHRGEETIRIISAWKAEKYEQNLYQENLP